MAVILFNKKGESTKCSPFSVKSTLMTGDWFLSLADAEAAEEIQEEEPEKVVVPFEEPVVEEEPVKTKTLAEMTVVELRELAKEAGIPHYYTKGETTLIAELTALQG